MPTSKKRKGAKKRTVRRVMPAQNLGEKWNWKLHASRLVNVCSDPDFLNIVKIGRVMNAVDFGVTSIAIGMKQENMTTTRHYRRGNFVLAGYLHEGIALVDLIKGRYLAEPEFDLLRRIALDSEFRDVRSYVKAIRNVTAFHLDDIDKTTKTVMADLPPTTYTIMAGDDLTAGGFYFELADCIDMTYLFEIFKRGREFEETAADIIHSVRHLAEKFLKGCHVFLAFLCRKVKLVDHTYIWPYPVDFTVEK